MTSDSATDASRQNIPTAELGVATPPPVLVPPSISGDELSTRPGRVRRIFGVMGVVVALPFFLWLPLGWLEVAPSMVDIFGVTGLRIPAGITVGGLLLAAIGFHDV